MFKRFKNWLVSLFWQSEVKIPPVVIPPIVIPPIVYTRNVYTPIALDTTGITAGLGNWNQPSLSQMLAAYSPAPVLIAPNSQVSAATSALNPNFPLNTFSHGLFFNTANSAPTPTPAPAPAPAPTPAPTPVPRGSSAAI